MGGSVTFGLRIMKQWTWFILWVHDVSPTLRFIHSTLLLSTCSILGTVIGTRGEQDRDSPCIHRIYRLARQTDNEEITKMSCDFR